MACSTSARSSIRLINASSYPECLQFRCMKVITKYPQLINVGLECDASEFRDNNRLFAFFRRRCDKCPDWRICVNRFGTCSRRKGIHTQIPAQNHAMMIAPATRIAARIGAQLVQAPMPQRVAIKTKTITIAWITMTMSSLNQSSPANMTTMTVWRMTSLRPQSVIQCPKTKVMPPTRTQPGMRNGNEIWNGYKYHLLNQRGPFFAFHNCNHNGNQSEKNEKSSQAFIEYIQD